MCIRDRADGIAHVVAQKPANIGKSLLALLAGLDVGEIFKAAAEKLIDQMLVHVGTHIAVVPVAQDGEVVEEDIRPLQSQLIQPAVLGNYKF